MRGGDAALRFRLVLLIALSLTLALGSFWVLQVRRKQANDAAPVVVRVAPDYYVHKFSYVKMAKSHQARYNISGDLLVHHPQDDSIEISRPVVHQLANGRPPIWMHSDTALVNSDDSEIRLIGNVDLDRPGLGPTEHFHLKAPTLLLLPDDDSMKTDGPVELQLGSSTLHGTGMFASNAGRQLTLNSRVHAEYLPVRQP